MPAVLIVEDDSLMREGFALLLGLEGIQVRTAANGKEGLAVLLAGWKPDLIILDLMMPVMNGFQFRQVQSGNPRMADIPVLVLSGVDDAAHKAASLNAAAVLQKPVAPPSLIRIVRQLIGGD